MWRIPEARPRGLNSYGDVEAGVGSMEGVWEKGRELSGAGAVDGGIRDCGAAVWVGGALVQRSAADQEASGSVAGPSGRSLRSGVGEAALGSSLLKPARSERGCASAAGSESGLDADIRRREQTRRREQEETRD